MKRFYLWLTPEQLHSLRLLGNVSEHIRRAIDLYLAKIEKKVSKSPSKTKL